MLLCRADAELAPLLPAGGPIMWHAPGWPALTFGLSVPAAIWWPRYTSV